jgi:hypothetical protein
MSRCFPARPARLRRVRRPRPVEHRDKTRILPSGCATMARGASRVCHPNRFVSEVNRFISEANRFVAEEFPVLTRRRTS